MTGSRVCFGYSIESSIDFQYLRTGQGDPLVVQAHDGTWDAADGEIVMDWPSRENRPVSIRLHRAGDGYGLWISDAGWYSIMPKQAQLMVPPGGNLLRREERLWGMPSILTFISRGDIPFHAAGVDIGGVAILFGGPTRHGKTTLAAALWCDGLRVLSEDVSCVGENAHVVPGPTMIRMRHDVVGQLTASNLSALARDDDRTHMVMTGTLADDASPVPLGAFVLLAIGDEIRLERVDPLDALPDLWVLTFHIPADEHEGWIFQRVAGLAAQVPVYRLTRPLRMDALPATIEAMRSLSDELVA